MGLIFGHDDLCPQCVVSSPQLLVTRHRSDTHVRSSEVQARKDHLTSSEKIKAKAD